MAVEINDMFPLPASEIAPVAPELLMLAGQLAAEKAMELRLKGGLASEDGVVQLQPPGLDMHMRSADDQQWQGTYRFRAQPPRTGEGDWSVASRSHEVHRGHGGYAVIRRLRSFDDDRGTGIELERQLYYQKQPDPAGRADRLGREEVTMSSAVRILRLVGGEFASTAGDVPVIRGESRGAGYNGLYLDDVHVVPLIAGLVRAGGQGVAEAGASVRVHTGIDIHTLENGQLYVGDESDFARRPQVVGLHSARQNGPQVVDVDLRAKPYGGFSSVEMKRCISTLKRGRLIIATSRLGYDDGRAVIEHSRETGGKTELRQREPASREALLAFGQTLLRHAQGGEIGEEAML
jgi:hypothetical protein